MERKEFHEYLKGFKAAVWDQLEGTYNLKNSPGSKSIEDFDTFWGFIHGEIIRLEWNNETKKAKHLFNNLDRLAKRITKGEILNPEAVRVFKRDLEELIECFE